jgi:hypothetical protein
MGGGLTSIEDFVGAADTNAAAVSAVAIASIECHLMTAS